METLSSPQLASDLAVHCIAAGAQAEELLRQLRKHTDDIHLTMGLKKLYLSTMRNALAVETKLMKVQALRQQRNPDACSADTDAETVRINEQCIMRVADAAPQAATKPPPETARKAASAPPVNQNIEGNISEYETNSHCVAFETELMAQPWNRGYTGDKAAYLRPAAREMAA